MPRLALFGLRSFVVLLLFGGLGGSWLFAKVAFYRGQGRLLQSLEARLGDGYRVGTMPAEPQWLWRALVGPDAVDVGNARLVLAPDGHGPVTGFLPGETEWVKGWTNTGDLAIAGAAVDDDLIRSVAENMPHLENLALLDTNVTSRGLEFLRNHRGVSYLHLIRTKETPLPPPKPVIGEEAIRALASLQLVQLCLSGYVLDDRAMEQLAQLKRLEFLELVDGEVSDANLDLVAALEHLRSLSLQDNPKITDAGIPALFRLRRLRLLDIRGTSITAGGLTALVKARPYLDPDHAEVRLRVDEKALDGYRRRKAEAERERVTSRNLGSN